MNILIVEDEVVIAEDIKGICAKILRGKVESIRCESTLANAQRSLAHQKVDLLILDLNLSGRDGFELLKHAVSYSFQTIVISANIDRALEAFEYGVLDFVPKPYNESRIQKALDRFQRPEEFGNNVLKYVTIRKPGGIRLIPILDIRFIKGADVYTELFLKAGKKALCDKTLLALSKILPNNFFRIHKSYIVDVNSINRINIRGGGKYEVELHSQEVLPVARSYFSALKIRMDAGRFNPQ